jgi:hypothetical protein
VIPDWVKEIAKAIVAGALAGIATATTALVGDGQIDTIEALAIASAVLVNGYGVWQMPDSMSPLRKALRASRR